MYLNDPFFEPENHWVMVWVGDLTIDELEDYIDEPGGVDDDEPFSEFSKDLGRWYDHDFVWAEGAETSVSIQELCEFNSVEPRAFVDEIVNRFGDNATSLLVLWNAKQISNSVRPFANNKLKFIGGWQQESPLVDP